MEGFLVSRWQDRWDEGINQNLQWIKEVLTKTSILVNNVANLNESSHCAQCSCNKKTKHAVQQFYFKKNTTFMELRVSSRTESSSGLYTKPLSSGLCTEPCNTGFVQRPDDDSV